MFINFPETPFAYYATSCAVLTQVCECMRKALSVITILHVKVWLNTDDKNTYKTSISQSWLDCFSVRVSCTSHILLVTVYRLLLIHVQMEYFSCSAFGLL